MCISLGLKDRCQHRCVLCTSPPQVSCWTLELQRQKLHGRVAAGGACRALALQRQPGQTPAPAAHDPRSQYLKNLSDSTTSDTRSPLTSKLNVYVNHRHKVCAEKSPWAVSRCRSQAMQHGINSWKYFK